MSSDFDVYDKSLGILVTGYGLTHLMGVLGVIAPSLVGIILPVLVILAGLRIITRR